MLLGCIVRTQSEGSKAFQVKSYNRIRVQVTFVHKQNMKFILVCLTAEFHIVIYNQFELLK